jgi:hypothetical protein
MDIAVDWAISQGPGTGISSRSRRNAALLIRLVGKGLEVFFY